MPKFEVILLSRNSPETGLRVFNTIEHLGLDICRAVFTSGESTSRYIDALETKLFLSSNPIEVKKAIEHGVAAATVIPAKSRKVMMTKSELLLMVTLLFLVMKVRKCICKAGLMCFINMK
jgi:hypothetical protein